MTGKLGVGEDQAALECYDLLTTAHPSQHPGSQMRSEPGFRAHALLPPAGPGSWTQLSAVTVLVPVAYGR